MEIILLILLATNLAATCWFGKQLLSREEYRIEFVSIPGEVYLDQEHSLQTQTESEQKEVPQPEAPAQTKAKVSYSAWENRTGLTNSPSGPAQKPIVKQDGERPYGWV